MSKSKQDYPIVFKASHVAEILDITEPTAYKLMDVKHFPIISFGRSKRVLRDEFFKWLEAA